MNCWSYQLEEFSQISFFFFTEYSPNCKTMLSFQIDSIFNK